jgi:hypothetical protein
LGPYYFNGRLVDPGVDVVSFYADQFPPDDMAREVASRFRIPLFGSIGAALCLGGKDLAVDAVLSIGEHGDYPYDSRGRQMYPRKRFYDEAVAVMRRSNRFIPFFNDKHFSYRWDWAREMVHTARRNRMPLLGGSSVPLAERRPSFELAPGTEIEEAVSIHGGGLESYDFHALEVLQSLVEGRKGGETGISSIRLWLGKSFKEAEKARVWSPELVAAARAAEEGMQAERRPRPTSGVFRSRPGPRNEFARPPGPHAISLVYKDGLKATVLRIGSDSNRWAFSCRLKGETAPRATAFFNSPWGNRGLFKALSHAIQSLFITGQEPYPAERTLLTTGAVEATMRSYARGGRPIGTPHLEFTYPVRDWRCYREMGATWKMITVDTPEPQEFTPRSFDELRTARS